MHRGVGFVEAKAIPDLLRLDPGCGHVKSEEAVSVVRATGETVHEPPSSASAIPTQRLAGIPIELDFISLVMPR